MKYPVGIQDFRELREGKYQYVDKTQYIHHILTAGKYFFLSRPRRFGKSLLLSTIKELYFGSRELFEGLWVEDHWDWEQANPVIHIKFASFKYKDNPLGEAIQNGLQPEAERLGVELRSGPFINPLEDLIHQVYEKYQRKVVLLIDEYDKPIIDYLGEPEQAEANRDTLKGLYSIIKDSDPYLELVFITGVSAFSKVSIFSDLNNLENITFSPQAYTLLGLTEEELERYFPEQLAAADVEKIKTWYNGYSWDGEHKVYNPFSILRFLKSGFKFENYWFETGTPTFLLYEMRRQHYYDLDGYLASPLLLNEFDLRSLHPVSVLFQTGYLTIKDKPNRVGLYPMGYPNQEVKDAFQERLLNVYAADEQKEARIRMGALLDALEARELDKVIEVLNATFASIPYDLWQKDNEHFYHALIHLTFSLMGAYVQSEVHTAKGRCDALVRTERYIYAFEFKLDKSAEDALRQIKEKGYLAPFADAPQEKIAVGINFSTADKRVEGYLVEKW
ncbi:MAG: ATP-binding protein [Phaeodactylibacter sp.]|nr:ATP-binding protein [Phaeodactylibacter sp.]